MRLLTEDEEQECRIRFATFLGWTQCALRQIATQGGTLTPVCLLMGIPPGGDPDCFERIPSLDARDRERLAEAIERLSARQLIRTRASWDNSGWHGHVEWNPNGMWKHQTFDAETRIEALLQAYDAAIAIIEAEKKHE